MNVHARPEQQIHPVSAQFQPLHLEQVFHQFRIEGAGEAGSIRQAERMRPAVHTDAGRAVRTASHRNAEFFQPLRHASEGSCSSGSDLGRTHSLSPHDAGKVFIGQLGKKRIHIRFAVIYIREPDPLIHPAAFRLRTICRDALLQIHCS